MGEVKQFKLPDLGEGLTEGDILKWTVAVGDTIEVNDTIAEVETVKAAVELPSPFAGVVTALHAAEGETVPVGTAIISIETTSAAPAAAAAGAAEDLVPAVPGLPGEGALPAEEKQMTLVGYGPREETGGRRRRRRPEATAAGAQASFNVPPANGPHPAPPLSEVEEPDEPVRGRAPAHRVLAKPPVRKLAKTLGVDLTAVTPTGPHGTISRDDVQSAANDVAPAAPGRHARDGGRETRIPIKGVRKHTAAAMVASAFTAPHVTEFITCDITATMELRDRVAARREFRDVKVSPLLFVAKAVLLAVGKTPEINATWDDSAGEIVVKHYVNLGIAAATGRGLIVPNIKDADRLTLHELATELGGLTETARAGKTSPADMSGGTFTITNVGVFGVDTGTPILNPGEAGILAFGAVRRMPWVVGSGADERIEPRWVTQLGLSFDHRLVDGQQGSHFLADVAAVLTDPGMSLL
ncbi:MAG: dihydrolipoamide acetyltransferase family protein [Jatrophihabitans sp.]|uniref:dihydrolipoamide acetyltransferase family protein n=1 Tax=Jatrophihabitans sp. TaxID=1932789 RepID=UPI00390FABC7